MWLTASASEGSLYYFRNLLFVGLLVRRVIVKHCRGSIGSKGRTGIFYFIFIKSNPDHNEVISATLVFGIIWRHRGNHVAISKSLLSSLSVKSIDIRTRPLFLLIPIMFKLLALTSVITSAVLAQTTVGFLLLFLRQLPSFIILFSL